MAHITSVRLKAFKSVGGEWVEVPLRPGLCAIVGRRTMLDDPLKSQRRQRFALADFPLPLPPIRLAAAPALEHAAAAGPNGCGKSSLLDAVLFAFAAPARSFGVSNLTELANSDSSEVGALGVRQAM